MNLSRSLSCRAGIVPRRSLVPFGHHQSADLESLIPPKKMARRWTRPFLYLNVLGFRTYGQRVCLLLEILCRRSHLFGHLKPQFLARNFSGFPSGV